MTGFGQNLRRLRKRCSLSQLDIANKLGVRGGTVSMYETGSREPDCETLIKLCDILDCTADDLLLGPPKNSDVFYSEYKKLEPSDKYVIREMVHFFLSKYPANTLIEKEG